MREILFRGRRTDNRKWVEGYLDYNDTTRIAFIRKPKSIYTDVDMVDFATVGQYTGLKDKNGKRIFEGDILAGAWNMTLVVYFDEDYLQFRAREISSYARENTIDYYNNGKLEVIGNIYDNPELSKKEENL